MGVSFFVGICYYIEWVNALALLICNTTRLFLNNAVRPNFCDWKIGYAVNMQQRVWFVVELLIL